MTLRAEDARKLMPKMNNEGFIIELPSRLESFIQSWERSITHNADLGSAYVYVPHPDSDLYPVLKKYFEERGFEVSELYQNKGFGDVHQVRIGW